MKKIIITAYLDDTRDIPTENILTALKELPPLKLFVRGPSSDLWWDTYLNFDIKE